MTATPGIPGTTAPEIVTRTEVLAPEAAEALAGLLGVTPPDPQGDLPPLWHWIYLLERRPQRDLGPDGHPTTGVPAPPGPGWLRMFAGGRVAMHARLRLGQQATRRTRLIRSVDKQGRSGPMTFATVRNEITQDGRTVITDEQDIVYRPAGFGLTPPAPSTDAEEATSLEMAVDPVVLFRFSTLTYNAHRIHYDLEYAHQEGYPNLVVHGPLQALLMGESLRRSGTPILGRQFAYRLLAPTFGAQQLRVTHQQDATGPAAQVFDERGVRTASSVVGPIDPPVPSDDPS